MQPSTFAITTSWLAQQLGLGGKNNMQDFAETSGILKFTDS